MSHFVNSNIACRVRTTTRSSWNRAMVEIHSISVACKCCRESCHTKTSATKLHGVNVECLSITLPKCGSNCTLHGRDVVVEEESVKKEEVRILGKSCIFQREFEWSVEVVFVHLVDLGIDLPNVNKPSLSSRVCNDMEVYIDVDGVIKPASASVVEETSLGGLSL
jgi:hypothetical protein